MLDENDISSDEVQCDESTLLDEQPASSVDNTVVVDDVEEDFIDPDKPFVVPKPQALQSVDPRDYRIRVVVAGTRGYNDRKRFHEFMCRFVARFKQPILFISGAAKTGADRLIILWCKKFGFPCLEMPADWDNHGKGAGYIRNAAMGRIATRVVAFYDGHSNGTANMIDIGLEKGIPVVIVKITLPVIESVFHQYSSI